MSRRTRPSHVNWSNAGTGVCSARGMLDPTPARNAFEFATRHAVCMAIGVRDGHHMPWGLQSALSTCLHSAAAMQVWWGHQMLVVENEASAHMRSASAAISGLRGPALKVFASVWPLVQSAVDRALLKGVGGTVFNVTLGGGLNASMKTCTVAMILQPIFSGDGPDVEGILCTLLPDAVARDETDARADFGIGKDTASAVAS